MYLKALAGRIIPPFMHVLCLLAALCVLVNPARAADPGAGHWGSFAGNATTPDEACALMWAHPSVDLDNGTRSRLMASEPGDIWWSRKCRWTYAGWLCPNEPIPPGAPSFCGYPAPGLVEFDCDAGYTRVFPGKCTPDPTPERPVVSASSCPAKNTDQAAPFSNPNPPTPNPVVLSTGAKIWSAVDFETDDGLFKIARNYRSSPGGYTHAMVQGPLGLANGWQFDFGMELQFSSFTGSPSSPNANVTLLAPDGSGYDFSLNSSGAFLPQATSGAVSYNYKVEYVGTLPANLATVDDAQTTWRVTGPDDRVWTLKTFAHVNSPSVYRIARPTQAVARDGYTWTFTYGTNGALSSITDTFGRSATFTWNLFYVTTLSNVSGALPYPEAVDTITFPGGTSVKYTYDPPPTAAPSTTSIQRLTKATLRNSGGTTVDSTTYHYEDTDFRFALTGLTDNRNIRVTSYVYDTLGRVIETKGNSLQNQIQIAYGSSGSQLTRSVTNPLGKVTVYNFQKQTNPRDIRLTAVNGQASTNCPASVKSFTYGTSGFVDTTTDEENRLTTYVRDTKGRPTEIYTADNLPEEQKTEITWDTNRNLPLTIKRPGLTATRVYNTSGQLTSLTETDTTTHTLPYATSGQTRVWTYTYTTGSRVQSVDGPIAGTGDTVSYTYDTAGYVKTFTNELAQVTTVVTVNGRGQPTQVQDANGLVTNLTYDGVGRLLTTVTDPTAVAATTTIVYDATGNVTKVTRPDGSFLQMVYDNNSRVTSVTNGFGDNAVYTYDAMGNVKTQQVSNDYPQLFFSWSRNFDELGRLIQVTGAGPASWAYGYDKVGNLKTVTDPNSKTASMAYDGLNRLKSFTDERLSVTSTTYGATADPASVTDPRSIVTSYVRNGWGEAIREQSADIGSIVYERDKNGRVTKRTDARSVVSNYAYDNAGRLSSVTYPAETTSNVTYTYDAVTGGNFGKGRLTGVTDAAGTVAYKYDLLGRMIQETRVIGTRTYVTAYTWNAAGRVTKITYPSGRAIHYDRDADGEVNVVRNWPSGGAQSWLVLWVGRTPFGPRSGIHFGNDIREWRGYDTDGRIASLETLYNPTSALLIDRTYLYADKRNLTKINDLKTPANTETFTYTDNGFLATAVGPWGNYTYTIDGVGNITQRVKSGSPAETVAFTLATGTNRLATMTVNGTLSRQFTPDAAGNITQDVAGSTTKVFAYDHPGQLKSVTVSGTSQGVYKYDYLARLVSRELPPSLTTLHLVHDLDGNVIAEYSAAGTLLREYVWMDDRPIAVIADAGTASPKTWWVHTDHLERPVMMTDINGATVWQALWQPFGGVQVITGTASLDQRFPGQWFQLESGLHYNWHRHYDPTTGRYIQPDPLGMPDGPSRWAYVRNTPLIGVDRKGLQVITEERMKHIRDAHGFDSPRTRPGNSKFTPRYSQPSELRKLCEQIFAAPDEAPKPWYGGLMQVDGSAEIDSSVFMQDEEGGPKTPYYIGFDGNGNPTNRVRIRFNPSNLEVQTMFPIE